jgi:hypothetical protein
MIIYTAMPLEYVLEGMDQQEYNYSEIEFGNMTMVVEQATPYTGKIVRLISPNPQDYLNPSYSPGQMIHFRPTFSK